MVLVITILSVLALLGVAAVVVLNMPVFGGVPSGARLERMKKSPNYRDGEFRNTMPTEMMSSSGGSGFFAVLWKMLFERTDDMEPDKPLTMVKRDLKHLPSDRDFYVWFGHSSYLLSLHGKTVLVDPVFYNAAPFPFLNKPFKGTDLYHPEDMPDKIDYLVITHDHYDHLEYRTALELRDRVCHVVCPLGVGAHFERWGYDVDKIIELDWNEKSIVGDGMAFFCLPARHFSGRTLKRNSTLWASFLLSSDYGNIFIGGDSGYGTHFKKIAEIHPDIDLAIIENGQYNEMWRYIHTLPKQLGKVASDLNADNVVTVHHSKFALARHAWDEPLRNEMEAKAEYSLNLAVAELGEITELHLK